MDIGQDYKPTGYAYYAGELMHGYCRDKFPIDQNNTESRSGVHMASKMLSGGFMDCFDHKGYQTHKYFDADAVNDYLGEPSGAGAYGRVIFSDGSCLYLTCNGRLAYSDATGTDWVD